MSSNEANKTNGYNPDGSPIESNSSLTLGKPAKSGSLEMTVIRANGDIEELGVVSYYNRNPIKNWWYNRKIKRRLKNGN